MEAGLSKYPSINSTSLETPSSEEYVFEDPTQIMICASISFAISFLGILGNSLVILAVFVSRKLQNRTNIFVVNLAFADFLTCLVIPFQAVAVLHDRLSFPDSVCRAVSIVMYEGLGSSVFNLAVIACMRFYIITKPREQYHKLFSKPKMTLLAIGAWLVPFLLIVFPPLFGIGRIGYSPRYRFCSADSSHPLSDIYALLASVVVGLPCLVFIIVCYVKIYLFVRASGRDVILRARTPSMQITERPNLPPNQMEEAVYRRQLKVTKNLFIVVCSFFICIIPTGVVFAIPGPVYPAVPWAAVLLICNSCVNPIIYSLRHPQFKEVLQPVLTCAWMNIRN